MEVISSLWPEFFLQGFENEFKIYIFAPLLASQQTVSERAEGRWAVMEEIWFVTGVGWVLKGLLMEG